MIHQTYTRISHYQTCALHRYPDFCHLAASKSVNVASLDSQICHAEAIQQRTTGHSVYRVAS